MQTSLLVASSLLLLVAALRVPIERKFTQTTELGRRPNPRLAAPANMAAAIEAYSPVLRLDTGEKWPERPIAHFLTASHGVAGTRDCFSPSDAHPHPPTCRMRAISDDRDGSFGMVGDPKHGGLIRGAIAYPLVARLKGDEPSQLPASLGRTHTIVEYWLFYTFDQWHAPTALGAVRQSHQADWEFVGVGLDARLLPTFVSYSEHCHGIWRPWAQTPVAAVQDGALEIGGGGSSTHPLVVVAQGSHANYPTTGTREPDWAGCPVHQPVVSSALDLLGFAANARESTSDSGPIEIPSVDRGLEAGDPTGLAPADRCTVASGQAVAVEPICRRMFWGDFETFRLGAPIGASDMTLIPPDDVGPASPGGPAPGALSGRDHRKLARGSKHQLGAVRPTPFRPSRRRSCNEHRVPHRCTHSSHERGRPP